MNTAAHLESKSLPRKILCSQKTVASLIAAGKEKWFVQREYFVNAKGKGLMQYYWSNQINLKAERAMSARSCTSSEDSTGAPDSDIVAQVVEWMTEVLESHLKKVVAARNPIESTLLLYIVHVMK